MAFTFTVEDGTGVAGANAYATTAQVDDYFAGVGGNTTWTASGTTQKQAAIVEATRYAEQRFRGRCKGIRMSEEQGLSWPRDSAFVDGVELDDQVPPTLINAIAEYAVRARSSSLLTDSPATTGGILEEEVKVGPIEERIKYAESGTRSSQSGLVSDTKLPEYPAGDLWIEPLLQPSGRSYR